MKKLILTLFMVLFLMVATGYAEMLKWDTSVGADGYRVYWGNVPGEYPRKTDVGNVTEVGTSGQDGALAEYFNLTPGTWYFIVRAYNLQGESDDSNIANFEIEKIIIEDNFPMKIVVPATTTITITRD